ncbi:MAG: hypothetical protein GX610_13335 [Rhodococcus sp.]|nr:hypothetical protein [Rhodococcus sp. (in: high G+C Gram-positive bacteria)]
MSGEVSMVDQLMAFAGQAKTGELVLDPDVATDCADACTEAIESLRETRRRMTRQTGLLPLGNFECGHQLAQILSDTTIGFIARIDDHITCLTAIHDMVGAQIAETLTTDEQTAQAMARVNGQL